MSNRTKQVQFRMPEELHTNLKAALAYEKSSLTDFFNYAAECYLRERNSQQNKKDKMNDTNGGIKNG